MKLFFYCVNSQQPLQKYDDTKLLPYTLYLQNKVETN